MKKQLCLLFTIFILLMLANCLKVNADVDSTFTISPDPITVAFLGYGNASWGTGYTPPLTQATIYSIELYQSTTYVFFGSFFVNDEYHEGNVLVRYGNTSDTHMDWEEYLIETGDAWYILKNWNFPNGQFNFEIPQHTSDTTLYMYLVITVGYYGSGYIQFALDLSYEVGSSSEEAYLDAEFGTFNYQYIITLFILVFIPSLIIGGIFSTHDLGFIGFLCGLNLMTGFSYTILSIPIWFMIVIMIIDVIIMLLILHGRGTI